MNKKTFILCLKIALTGLLVIFLCGLINVRVQKLRAQAKNFSWNEILRVNQNKVRGGARTKSLNQLIPDFNYLIRFNRGQETFKETEFKNYREYYQRLVEYYPQLAEGYALLGFCAYYEGRLDAAVAAFKKAIALYPDSFWFHYDLGAVYLKQGRFSEASQSLTRALAVKPDATLRFMLSSKVYQQILGDVPNLQPELIHGIKTGYAECVPALKSAVEKNPSALRVKLF